MLDQKPKDDKLCLTVLMEAEGKYVKEKNQPMEDVLASEFRPFIKALIDSADDIADGDKFILKAVLVRG